MKVFRVTIQLPEWCKDKEYLAEARFINMIRQNLDHRYQRIAPEGSAVSIHDSITGQLLHQTGSFTTPKPDAESAAEIKGDEKREGGK